MKVVILGGNGFIGKNIYRFLKENTQHEVNAPNRSQLNLLDELSCEEYFTKIRADFVIHSAVNINSVEETLRIFFNVLNQKKKYGHLIQLGSGAEYDKRTYSPLMVENFFGNSIPTDSYGLSKYLIGREIESRKFNALTNLRLFGIYGPFEDITRRFISNNICRVLCGLPISVNRDMNFDYMYVDDLSRLLARIINGLKINLPSYNVCSGRPVSLIKIGQIIQKEMGQNIPITVKHDGLNPEYSGNPNRLLNEIKEFQLTPLEIGIKNLIYYYKKNISSINLEIFKESVNE